MNTDLIPSWFEITKDSIAEGFSVATENIQKIAEIYVKAIDKDPKFRDYLTDELPAVSGGIWRSLEMVGRGLLDSRIAAGGVPFGHKLRKLTVSEQRQALDGTLPLLTSTGDTLQVKIDALMPKQADQVFASNHIRSLAEQRAWQEDKAQESKKKIKLVHPVEINKKRRCIVVNGITLTAADLADYLRKISE